MGQPVATDDSATVAEDHSITVDVAANDSRETEAYQPELVAGPLHGTVQLTADGRYTYTPDPDYFGEDSFSYRLSEGVVQSNVATVTLTVTPVNDAPVLAGSHLVVAEDDTVL